MELLLMGTGAADGIPGMFAENEVSQYARRHGGKDVRSRSCAYLDSGIQIDMPPDIYGQMVRHGVSGLDWSALLFTHGHDDHAALTEIQYALYPFVEQEYLPFPIFASRQVGDRIESLYPNWPLEIVRMVPFETRNFADVTITTVAANHKEDEDSFNFILEQGGRKLLYATDTGIYPDSTFEFLAGRGLDALVIECTEGFHRTSYHGHLDIQDCIRVVTRMREDGALGPGAQVVTTHHSHEGGATHHQLKVALEDYDIEPGFDGMRILV
jgi:phosphoribosyl 1,2-cyclic phosphate phosphodiesterase